MTRGSYLIRQSFEAVPLADELMGRVSPALCGSGPPGVLKGRPMLGWRVSSGVSVVRMEGLAALIGRTSSVWIGVRQRAPEGGTWRGRGRLAVFIHVQGIGVLVWVHGRLERTRAVLAVRINGASGGLGHGGLGPVVPVGSGRRRSWSGEVGLGRGSVVIMRGAGERGRRPSGTMEVERRRRGSRESWRSQAVLSVESRGHRKTLRGPLRPHVLGGHRVVKHLWGSSLAHGLEGE